MATANEVKYTPGPWDCYIEEAGFGVYQNNGNHNGDHIMCVEGDAETHANCCLIGASPELLEALKKTIPLLQAAQRKGLLDEALAVIAKAEGR